MDISLHIHSQRHLPKKNITEEAITTSRDSLEAINIHEQLKQFLLPLQPLCTHLGDRNETTDITPHLLLESCQSKS